MAVSPELIEILRCPKCKSKVELIDEGRSLRAECDDNVCVFEIRDGIPVMLMDEAQVTPKQTAVVG